ncbi:AAA family ATPase [uncultured Porticoccus sp.]|uniref:ExeA family protein n=2 Tax=Porticoccus TaxID=1123967 RepID=UPI0030D6CD8F|tara:strand:+ start:47273 stop:48490 length:1218 start_codon:yes stop_codon:yes gene_type:complete
MYEQFYDLKAEPFRLSPDHRFCFNHRSYAKAKAYMQYAFQRAEGFVMITGKPGTGKTTLVSDLVESLREDQVNVAMLVCTQLGADDLLRMVADAFGLSSNTDHKSLLLQQLTRLFVNDYKTGKRALLIIDEAQDLSTAALEELRLLTNLQMSREPLLQIFLLGQEELRDIVQQPNMEQVHQRLVAACHLASLNEEETKGYIKHRLNQVGWNGDPAISNAIYPVIHKVSEGIPRRINMICSRLFLHACVEELHKISINDAKIVLGEINQEQLTSKTMLPDLDFAVEDTYDAPPQVAPAAVSDTKKKVVDISDTVRKAPPAPTPQAGLAIQPKPEEVPPSKESLFQAKELTQTEVYRGPDSRKGERRSFTDPRQEVRYEPGKKDRRQNPGRRKEDKEVQKRPWQFWI